jgi:hypothetical protein
MPIPSARRALRARCARVRPDEGADLGRHFAWFAFGFDGAATARSRSFSVQECAWQSCALSRSTTARPPVARSGITSNPCGSFGVEDLDCDPDGGSDDLSQANVNGAGVFNALIELMPRENDPNRNRTTLPQ